MPTEHRGDRGQHSRRPDRRDHSRWVDDRGTPFHAISLCNLAELTMGAAVEATLPADLDRIDLAVEVEVTDDGGTVVFTARIDLWITPRA